MFLVIVGTKCVELYTVLLLQHWNTHCHVLQKG
jgi:hypothetical protein